MNTVKINVSFLAGPALDWAVAIAEGDRVFRPRLGRPDDWDKEAYLKDGSDDRWVVRVQNPTEARFVDWPYCPSTSWQEGGPIIEREGMQLQMEDLGEWHATMWWDDEDGQKEFVMRAPTPLIAAMRCYVASKLGEIVEVPSELFKEV